MHRKYTRLITLLFVAILGALPMLTAAQTPTATPEPVHERCVAATSLPLADDVDALPNPDRPENEQIIADIEYGLKDGATISDVWVVQSEDFEDGAVWFVSARLQVAGVDDDGITATWATSRINPDGAYTGVGLLFSVDAFANEFSEWGDGGQTQAQLSMGDDGAEESAECARGED